MEVDLVYAMGTSPRGRTPEQVMEFFQVCETNQGEPSMNKSMESNTAGIYLQLLVQPAA